MAAINNCQLGVRTDRVLMIVLDEANIDVFRKVMSIYFHHHVFNEIYLTDTTGPCGRMSIYIQDISVAVWQTVFKILNLEGYYVVHDINYPELWMVGTYDELVEDEKYKEYLKLVDELAEGGKIIEENE